MLPAFNCTHLASANDFGISHPPQDDARFSYFCDTVLPQLLRLEQKHTLIYASSYFEFVRIRNELIRRKVRQRFGQYMNFQHCVSVVHFTAMGVGIGGVHF